MPVTGTEDNQDDKPLSQTDFSAEIDQILSDVANPPQQRSFRPYIPEQNPYADPTVGLATSGSRGVYADMFPEYDYTPPPWLQQSFVGLSTTSSAQYDDIAPYIAPIDPARVADILASPATDQPVFTPDMVDNTWDIMPDLHRPIEPIVAVAPTTTPSLEERVHTALDVNGDGNVTIDDRLDVLTLTTDKNAAISRLTTVMDTNGDGRFTRDDDVQAVMATLDQGEQYTLSALIQRSGIELNDTNNNGTHDLGEMSVALTNFAVQQSQDQGPSVA